MFLTEGFVKRERVLFEIGDELKCLLGEFLAVIVRGVIPRIAIEEPALQVICAE